MAFAYKILRKVKNHIGDRAVIFGSFTGAGVTSGNINTTLDVLEFLHVFPAGATTQVGVASTAFPRAGSAGGIVFDTGTQGMWMAYGY